MSTKERGFTEITLGGVSLKLQYKTANLRRCIQFCGFDAYTLLQKIAERPMLSMSLDVLLGLIAIGLVTDSRYRSDEADSLLDKLSQMVDKEQAKSGGPIIQAMFPHAQKVLQAFSYGVLGKDIFEESMNAAGEDAEDTKNPPEPVAAVVEPVSSNS